MGEIFDSRTRGALFAVFVLLAVFLAVEVAQGLKEYRFIGGGVPVSNIITVEGKGEVFAVPDIASFSFTVREEDPSVAKAQQAAAEKVNRALAYLREAGIAERDLKTESYTVFPRYEYLQKPCTQFGCPPGERVFKGFEAGQTVSVKVRDTEKAGTLLAGVGEIGVESVSGLAFTFDDEEALLREARAKAIENAREKAKALAKDLDVRLLRIVSFSEFRNEPPFYKLGIAEAGAADGRGGAPEVPAGENKITSTVSVSYEIR